MGALLPCEKDQSDDIFAKIKRTSFTATASARGGVIGGYYASIVQSATPVSGKKIISVEGYDSSGFPCVVLFSSIGTPEFRASAAASGAVTFFVNYVD